MIERLAICEYITKGAQHFITVSTGSGKTYMACALGMEACEQHFKTRYIRLPDLLLNLEMARMENNYRKTLMKYANLRLLIMDEWLLLKSAEMEQHGILELLHARRRKASTIFCSHQHNRGWYDQIGGDDSPLEEVILDRSKHDAYKAHIIPTNPTNYRSMWKVYGL